MDVPEIVLVAYLLPLQTDSMLRPGANTSTHGLLRNTGVTLKQYCGYALSFVTRNWKSMHGHRTK